MGLFCINVLLIGLSLIEVYRRVLFFFFFELFNFEFVLLLDWVFS